MKTVYFHGALADRCPEPIVVNASTINGVLEALKVHPTLDPKLTNTRYEAKIDGLANVTMMDHEWQSDEVHIHCTGKLKRLVGAGGALRNPWVRIVVAIIIVVVAFMSGQLYMAEGALQMTFIGSLALSFGVAMAAGALTELLAPSPDTSDEKSHLSSDFRNTVAAGTTIPVVIGEHLWGGHYISFNTKPATRGNSNGGNGGGGGTGGGGGSITQKQR